MTQPIVQTILYSLRPTNSKLRHPLLDGEVPKKGSIKTFTRSMIALTSCNLIVLAQFDSTYTYTKGKQLIPLK
ncbi:hypothetical protein BRADI_3g23226v3 [Brachypodium distachyon]|uniref:Uncharacterized protein n=1 Tax=Brachypodium distachyon TaxID=15368 RepID=A0A0Q3JDT5_BRADI|nr:hypothetical protein BRADI_3g23226v3 [Brachypodium distachyon]